MNKRRRNSLHLILDELERLRDPVINNDGALKILNDAQIKIVQCIDEEEDALDNRPESFQFSSENDDMSNNISDLSDANDNLEIIIEKCNDMDGFDYELIKDDIIKVVRTIRITINR